MVTNFKNRDLQIKTKDKNGNFYKIKVNFSKLDFGLCLQKSHVEGLKVTKHENFRTIFGT